jgi:hypothetical protein
MIHKKILLIFNRLDNDDYSRVIDNSQAKKLDNLVHSAHTPIPAVTSSGSINANTSLGLVKTLQGN